MRAAVVLMWTNTHLYPMLSNCLFASNLSFCQTMRWIKSGNEVMQCRSFLRTSSHTAHAWVTGWMSQKAEQKLLMGLSIKSGEILNTIEAYSGDVSGAVSVSRMRDGPWYVCK
ncbi:hypothetical protein BJ138DRAFT_1158513 [Hygrophoropsis aurantiaca]|uniref:Uncharacterized protein n=1 Tax=Hygrophoropsis aurantiaca TaxID=72124 RepID=A0ACB8A4P3_9AGAM|nr:hypothetical protein BJ138DRAFT_1158513 [Hygrophoropsis aurantiaca]